MKERIIGGKQTKIVETDSCNYVQQTKRTSWYVVHSTETEEWFEGRMLSRGREHDTLKKFRSLKKAVAWCLEVCGGVRCIKDTRGVELDPYTLKQLGLI